jgi:hypothetical protein
MILFYGVEKESLQRFDRAHPKRLHPQKLHSMK